MFNVSLIPSETPELPLEQSLPPMASPQYVTAHPLVSLHAFQNIPRPSQPHFGREDVRQLNDKSVQLLLDEFASVVPSETSKCIKLNITDIKILLSTFNDLLTEFEGIINYLQVTKKSLSPEEWNSKVVQAEQKKEDLANIYNSLADPLFTRRVVATIKSRKNKRKWRKKKKILWQEKKKNYKLLIEKEHKRIDLWLEKMKDEVERARRSEEIKKDGDLVLADVTQKKSSAKRFLNLLNTLVKLRSARVQQAIASGKTVSAEDNDTFVKVIDKLKTMWVDQMKEYNLEEKGLRVLLEDAQTERVNVQDKLQKRIFQEWQELFFGRDKVHQLSGPATVEEFIAARSAWDRFVSETEEATAIPIGWVIPSEPSDADWAGFIANH